MLDNFTDWRDEWALVLDGSVNTKSAEQYLRCVGQFITWAQTEHPDVTDVADVTDKHATGWAAHLVTERKLAPATRRVRLLSLRFWFGYMATQQDSGVRQNPFALLKLPVPDEKPVPVIPDAELAALLRTASGSDFISIRDNAILRVLLDTGIRRGELVNIDVADVDFAQHEITVTGKGGRTRIVPLSPKTVLALRKYMRARARRPASTARPLFLSIRPDDRGVNRLTGGGLFEMVKRRCKAAGLVHRWPHQLRHTWAHDMLDNGANEQDVERLGGWTRGSKMVKRYGSSMADERARKRSRDLARGDRV
ncbi:tyrosine-type recombinase/integrase [Amycolatopsis sp., V23-08]|uniref:Tyrosine-type recombinase/integrase n=1 Tax=Amycolatopsis heterodermiae TaxID=3110235 RepID=A0ABU5RPD3_9PSEU|nr:tyrosine-type recombinase/integrase [Amycolatopsis sp., V23-08]MEA5367769.1 tyrosine-type recombinase/integrase [Amycolatopsis sp., V23-08]